MGYLPVKGLKGALSQLVLLPLLTMKMLIQDQYPNVHTVIYVCQMFLIYMSGSRAMVKGRLVFIAPLFITKVASQGDETEKPVRSSGCPLHLLSASGKGL